MNHQIISTKLKQPNPRRNYIVREQLYLRLKEVTEVKLSVLQSGAGSGKTTLLASFIEREKIGPVKWLNIDDSMNHIQIFWNYILELLKENLLNDKEDYLSFLMVESEFNNEQFIATIINDLDDEEVFLILDDFHYIKDEEILELFSILLKESPYNYHFILLSRDKPQIYLAGYEMNNDLLHFEDQDFLINDVEAYQFLKETLALPFSKNVLQHLITLADGWIGGLQLLAVAARNKNENEILNMNLTHTMLNEYLQNEIFASFSEQEQEFLIETAMSSYFCKELSNQLFPNLNYDEMLDTLLNKNLLLQCIDENKKIYRYHHILKEYFNECIPEQAIELIHQQSAKAFIELNDVEEALYHLFEIKDYKQIMNLLIQMPQDAQTGVFISKVPISEVIHNFDFAYQKFFFHYGNLDVDTCDEMYEVIKPYIDKDPMFKAFSGMTVLLRNGYVEFDDSVFMLDELDKMKTNNTTKALLFLKNATFLHYHDRHNEALQLLDRGEKVLEKTKNVYIRYYLYNVKSQIYEEMGRLNEALDRYEDIVTILSDDHALKSMELTYEVSKAGALIKQMRLNEAMQCLENAKEGRPEDFGTFELAYLYNLVECYYLNGQPKKGYETFLELLKKVNYDEDPLVAAALIRYPSAENQLSQVIKQSFMETYEKKDERNRNLNSQLSYIRLLAIDGKTEEAIQMVDEVLKCVRKEKFPLKIIEAILLKLTILNNSGDLRVLFDLYRETIYYAMDNDIKQPFYIERKTIMKLLNSFHDEIITTFSKQEKLFHEQILLLCRDKDNGLLSERELEVLSALAKGLTNPKIAEELYISIATVKTHILNIYRKLEVNSRINAISKAKELGILQ